MIDLLSGEDFRKGCGTHAGAATSGGVAGETGKAGALSSETKFCRDCAHFVPEVRIPYMGIAIPAMCAQPPERNLVTGHKKGGIPAHMRAADGACGIEGVLWIPAPAPVAPEPSAVVVCEPVTSVRWWEFWK